jgi:hypothetical protein
MEAFVWIERRGIFSLRQFLIDAEIDMNGWTLEVATAVSADGRSVVGYGPHNGNYEAWVAFLGSEELIGDIAPPGGDGVVGPGDLAELLAQWGRCPPPDEGDCTADIAPQPDGDGSVGPADLAELLANWG